VVGVISPWNYPLTLGISDALPALIAGNAVIAKPDGQTPYAALWAAELLEEAGLPAGVLQVVTGSGPELGTPRVSGTDQAIEQANDSCYGLNFSVWTRDAGRGREIATRLETGSVNVNEAYAATWGSVDAPMGGWKDSGVGSRHGEHGILKYTDAQTISVQRLMPIAPPGAMPPALYARAMTAAMRTLQRLPGRK
jgi:acyl-CoA reductase-like NAD-dependent aldehyde dehydrogenase